MTERWDKAAEKLRSLTESNTLRWVPTYEVSSARGNEPPIVGPAYVADVADRRIAVYEFQYGDTGGTGAFGQETGIAVEFIDGHWQPLWVWPVSGQIKESLLSAVRYQTARPDEFLETFLAGTA